MMLLASGSALLARYGTEPWLGQLVCPRSRNRVTLPRWAADNAAFSHFDADAYVRMLLHYQGTPGCLFVTVPDVVGDAAATLQLWWHWWGAVKRAGYPPAFVLQDGALTAGIPWDLCRAVFVGGTTAFKVGGEARELIAIARRLGRWVHMGRVNTGPRLKYAQQLGVDSVDGSGFSRWPDAMLPRFTRVNDQGLLYGPTNPSTLP